MFLDLKEEYIFSYLFCLTFKNCFLCNQQINIIDMGLFDVFKTVLGNSNNIASVIKLLNGKVDAKSLATIFATYLLKSKLASSSSAANSEAASFAQQVASAVNLSQCSGIGDVISKLTASDKQGTDDLASKLTQAVNLIKTLNTKA